MKTNLTGVRKALMESLFDPKVPGPMGVIVQVGNEPTYLMQRSRELLLAAESPRTSVKDTLANLTTAMSLIALAKVMLMPEVKPAKKALPVAKNSGPEVLPR